MGITNVELNRRITSLEEICHKHNTNVLTVVIKKLEALVNMFKK